MSDTPETDKAERMAFSQEHMVPTEFARQLERERNQLREIVEQRLLAGAEIHQRANDLLRSIQMLEEDRNRLKEIVKTTRADSKKTKSQIDRIREDVYSVYFKVSMMDKKLGAERDDAWRYMNECLTELYIIYLRGKMDRPKKHKKQK